MVRAFLIGAGATVAQYPEAPLSDNFFQKLKKTDLPLYNKINSSIHHYLGPSPAPLEEFNVEDVMMISSNFHHSVKNDFIADLHTSIYRLLASLTESNSDIISAYLSGARIGPSTLFKTLLLDSRLSENDFFMTLNYDLYLDREILMVNDGYIDYGINDTYVSTSLPNNVFLGREGIFSIYHLHGALNWEKRTDPLVRVHLGAIPPKHTRNGSNIYIVPPGNKELNLLLQSVWRTAEMRLESATELIIIGCSLNTSDTMLIGLINKFIKRNGSHSVKVITRDESFDPLSFDTYLNNNYTKILGMNVRRYNDGFALNNSIKHKQGVIEFIFAA